MRSWHWMSGAICLIGMVLFAATGITLNHAHQIKAQPTVTEKSLILSEGLRVQIGEDVTLTGTDPLPADVRAVIRKKLGIELEGRVVEWTDIDAYVGLPRPGGDAWLSIDRETGEVYFEKTHRGAVAYLNDLHKGRNTGAAWSWFLDVFSAATIIFCLSGLWLLQISAGRRKSTWPITVAGFAAPLIILLLLVH